MRMRALPLWGRVLAVLAVLAAATVALAYVPTGEVAYVPTAPIDLDGKIRVDGEVLEPVQGRLFLVGVTERPVHLLQRVLLGLTDPAVDFGPAPDGAEATKADVAAMADAKQVAAGVAFDLVDPGSVEWSGNGAAVDRIGDDSPAKGVLALGDIIRGVNGVEVDSAVDVARIVAETAPGRALRLELVRAGRARTETVRTIEPDPGDTVNRSRLGLALSTPGLDVEVPRTVSVDSGAVVGPSAGLAFALYLYDALSPDDVVRGRYVVASGAISPEGQVVPVGRMRQKAIAAQKANRDLLLVPTANAAEAKAAVAETCTSRAGCVEVVPVRSVAEAVELLSLDDAALSARLSSDE